MRICVFGAGAVGGYLAARLLKEGSHEIAVVARGEQLQAIRLNGLTLLTTQERFSVRPDVLTDQPNELKKQDVVFVTLKSHWQSSAAKDIASLLSPTGIAVFVNNGIPWWWTYRGLGVPASPLPLLDPDANLWTHVGAQRSLGCVVYSANEVVKPGVVRHSANNLWLLGEPDNNRSERLLRVTGVLCDSQLCAEAVTDIRKRIWTKLLRNAPLNSLCALTRLTVDQLSCDRQLLALCDSVVDEIAAIAAAGGVDLLDQVEIAKEAPKLGASIGGSAVTGIRPSMLQDAMSGRTMEVEAILGQVQQFARSTGTPCPVLDVLLPLARGLDHRA